MNEHKQGEQHSPLSKGKRLPYVKPSLVAKGGIAELTKSSSNNLANNLDGAGSGNMYS
jgi:hypothetical protein